MLMQQKSGTERANSDDRLFYQNAPLWLSASCQLFRIALQHWAFMVSWLFKTPYVGRDKAYAIVAIPKLPTTP